MTIVVLNAPLHAQTVPSPNSDVALPPVTVNAAPEAAPAVRLNAPVAPLVDRYALPQTRESITRQQIDDTTNAVDAEDALKYLPSIFIRKRNYGDTQPTVETRTYGVNSSARSLVYVDDVLISALIANNNTIGAPRWGMVSPELVQGIDVLYGPFAAAYPGNSEGGVLLITTRMPTSLETTFKQTGALQDFSVYKTNKTFGTSETTATIGDKVGRVSAFLSANEEISYSQPLVFITNSTIPAGTVGTIPALSKVGAVANVVGAGGLLRSDMGNLTGKVAVDLTDWLQATYSVGYWSNNTQSRTQTYLTDTNGNPTFGGVSGFASNTYNLVEQHVMNALSLKSDTHGDWDGEVVLTRYDFLEDIQDSPTGVLTGTNFKTSGYVARLDGTAWSTQDAKAIWRPNGPDGAQEISAGLHRDQYILENPTLNTANWQAAPSGGNGTLYTDGQGKTETYGLWAQDAIKLPYHLKLTVGGRLEQWQAYDGYNLSGTVAKSQPTVRAQDAAPKASLAWQIAPDWTTSFSFGQASRFPTVAELYQIVSTGSTYVVPNANLKPERDTSYEIAVTRQTEHTRVRLSLFEDDNADTLVQQTNLINNTYTSVWDNVTQTRNRGVELVAEEQDFLLRGLELSNSVTYVDSRIVSDPGFVSATGTTATGKHVPYVPDWRDTAQVTYRPADSWALSVAARYSGKMYSTLDNTDSVAHVMGAFDRFFVVDAHVRYQLASFLTASAGIDNVLNEKYFEYHPFPGRTYVASLRLTF
jgi:iron complex outermembrane receptor protein